MQFNSIEYLIFFLVVVFLYHVIPFKHRWKLLLAGSYYFYMCWKVEYVLLILFSTSVDYWAGLRMSREKNKSGRKKYLILSLVANLGLLFFFKYNVFFFENVEFLFSQFNIFKDLPEYSFLLPVGISFYTFQTLSYTIDVYRGDARAEPHFGYFALYVSYFPQLVAGPIERSNSLLPQLKHENELTYSDVQFGIHKILLGFFKKLVVADTCAIYVDLVFGNTAAATGIQVYTAMTLFAIQIYSDFSGYTDIAIGSSKLLGINLMENFNRPMWVRSFQEFWSKWHISLTLWVNDYLYHPLLEMVPRNRRSGPYRSAVVLFVMIVIGLWHGAKWTFVLFGIYNALIIIFQSMLQRIPFLEGAWNSKWYDAIARIWNWNLLVLGIALFRAENIEHVELIYTKLFSDFRFSMIEIFLAHRFELLISLLVSGIAIILLYFEKEVRFKYFWTFIVALVLMILLMGQERTDQFIYYQF